VREQPVTRAPLFDAEAERPAEDLVGSSSMAAVAKKAAENEKRLGKITDSFSMPARPWLTSQFSAVEEQKAGLRESWVSQDQAQAQKWMLTASASMTSGRKVMIEQASSKAGDVEDRSR
jgi:hypothetical protein